MRRLAYRLERQDIYARALRARAEAGPPFKASELAPSLVREVSKAVQETNPVRCEQRLLNAIDVMRTDADIADLCRLAESTPAVEVCFDHAEEAARENAASQPYARLPVAFAGNGAKGGSGAPDHVVVVECGTALDFVRLVNTLNAADVLDMQKRAAGA